MSAAKRHPKISFRHFRLREKRRKKRRRDIGKIETAAYGAWTSCAPPNARQLRTTGMREGGGGSKKKAMQKVFTHFLAAPATAAAMVAATVADSSPSSARRRMNRDRSWRRTPWRASRRFVPRCALRACGRRKTLPRQPTVRAEVRGSFPRRAGGSIGRSQRLPLLPPVT